MESQAVWHPADICEMFGISKSTLFRWEKEGKIPPSSRDEDQNRFYTVDHVAAITMLMLQRRFDRLMRNEEQPDAQEKARLLAQELSLYKFFFEGEKTGYYELSEQVDLSPMIVHRLLQEALAHRPSEQLFRDIIGLVYNKTVKNQPMGGQNDTRLPGKQTS